MGKLPGLGLEPFILPRLELGVPDLGDDMPEVVGAALHLVALAGQGGLLLPERLELAPGTVDTGA